MCWISVQSRSHLNWNGLTQQGLVCTKTTAHQKTAGHAALHEDARRYGGLLWPPGLDQYKSDQKYESEHKQRNDTTIIPL